MEKRDRFEEAISCFFEDKVYVYTQWVSVDTISA